MKLDLPAPLGADENGQGAGPEVDQLADGLEPFEGDGVKPGSHVGLAPSRSCYAISLASLSMCIPYSIPNA